MNPKEFDEKYIEAFVKFVKLMHDYNGNIFKVIEHLQREKDILTGIVLGTFVGVTHGLSETHFAMAFMQNYHWCTHLLKQGEKPEKLIEMLKRAEREQRMRDFAMYGAI